MLPDQGGHSDDLGASSDNQRHPALPLREHPGTRRARSHKGWKRRVLRLLVAPEFGNDSDLSEQSVREPALSSSAKAEIVHWAWSAE